MEMEYNCKYTGKRCAHTWTIMDGEASITVLRPYSGEFKDKEQYLVVYEDAYGETKTTAQTLTEISMFYMIDIKDLEYNLL